MSDEDRAKEPPGSPLAFPVGAQRRKVAATIGALRDNLADFTAGPTHKDGNKLGNRKRRQIGRMLREKGQ